MSIKEIKSSYTEALGKYIVFDGRSGRLAFWTFVLTNFAISLIIAIVDTFSGINAAIFGLLFFAAIVLPGIALGTRRLHDIGKSGWWMLFGCIPVIGWIILIYFFIQESEPVANVYGPAPIQA